MTGARGASVYGATRKEASDKFTEAMSAQEDLSTYVPFNVTAREFLTRYEDVAKEAMTRRGFEAYHHIAKKHPLPAIPVA